jgi:hypothetical protein
MGLLEDDERYLNEKGLRWRLEPDGEGQCLIIEGYPVSGDVYDRTQTDLLIKIPPQYNNTKLDMFYVDPPLRLKGTTTYPDRANTFIRFLDRDWQQFSRHFPDWKAGRDGVPTLMTFVQRELQRKN